MSTPTPPTDLIAALSTLTAGELRDRLHALDAERRAVLVLLRSVAARERAQRHQPPGGGPAMPRLTIPAADPAANGATVPGAAKHLPLLLTARQAAELCGVSEATWWRLHAAAKCPAPVKIGNSTRWRVEELRAWTEANCPPRAEWEAMSAADNSSRRPR
jgi:predicted DNA-binding transcriptional regulator AlpA